MFLLHILLYKIMKGRVRWDETNLDEINKNKPVRKKIDEPKTPYHPILGEDGCSPPEWDSDSSDSISYAAHAEAVRIALNKVALTQSQNPSAQFGDPMDKEEGSVKDPRGIKFEEHRRAHYDEFKKMKELKQEGSFPDYEDLDDYSDHEGICSQPSEFKEIYIHSHDEILKIVNIEGNS